MLPKSKRRKRTLPGGKSLIWKAFFRRNKKRVLALLGLILLIIAGYNVYLFIVSSDHYLLKRYKVTGVADYVNSEDLDTILNANILGKNILTYNTSSLADTLKTNFFGIKQVEIKKQLPDMLQINIVERFPIAILRDANDKLFLIDLEGYVLGEVDNEFNDLPNLLYRHRQVHIGEKLDGDVINRTIPILNEADTQGLRVSSMSYGESHSSFYVEGGGIVLLGKSKDVPLSVKIIKTILEKSQKEEEKVTKIDLRYDKVIVSYE